MFLAELWRYPVKSMAGETLGATVLGPLGTPGDRELYVVDGSGRIVDARGRPELLLHRASVNEKGTPTVDGLEWDDPEVARRVRVAAGEGARLVRARAGERFDILPLLVATDGAIAALGADRRRLRPNLVVGGVDGLSERSWEGKFLRIGGVIVGLHSLRQRCIMTTWDPDTGAQDVSILRRIHAEFDGKMALNAWTVTSGRVAIGDPVELIDRREPGTAPILGRFGCPTR